MVFGLFKKSKPTRESVIKSLEDFHEGFEGKDLSGLDLSGLKMARKGFEKANLQNTNFSGSSFDFCQFEEADLKGANFSKCTILTCNFERADMRGAKLDAATIKSTRFEQANTEGVTFAGTRFSNNHYDDTTLDGAVDDTGAAEGVLEDWANLQAMIAWVEGGGLDLCGVSANDLIGYHQRNFAIENAQMQGQDYETAIRKAGFPGIEHFEKIRSYIHAKYSYLGKNDEGKPDIQTRDEFMNAMMQARMGQVQGMQAAAAASDPKLLAPVDGVSVEKWGQAAAALSALGQAGTAAQADAVLAKLGMDRAKWDRANAGWTAKMQGDTTGAIATKFGAAFQGQHATQTGQTGGGEPCTFEKYVEVMTAQSAWSSQGRDIPTELKKVFGITINDYSNYGAYWAQKMSTDISFATKYTSLSAKYEAKYAAAGFDDDLGV
jgi:uncharacterized protein YjbI with pentapeptide repeats